MVIIYAYESAKKQYSSSRAYLVYILTAGSKYNEFWILELTKKNKNYNSWSRDIIEVNLRCRILHVNIF